MSLVEEQMTEEREHANQRPRARNAPPWMWFLSTFGILVLVGGTVLYAVNRSQPQLVGAAVADSQRHAGDADGGVQPHGDEDAPAEPAEAEPPDEMVMPEPAPAAAPPKKDKSDGRGAARGPKIIDIEMVEFGYSPETIKLKAGAPVVLRFTNSGRLIHEAMVGDAHMQDEFAGAGDHDDGGGGDHHGDVMAVTVEPGETQDLKVRIDEPGTWYMACHLTGHYEQGQVATIKVT